LATPTEIEAYASSLKIEKEEPLVARFFGFSTQHQQCHRRYARLKPWHSKQFKLCLTPFGRLPINPRASPWNSALGLLEKKISPSPLASRKVELKDVRQGWIK